MIEKMLAKAEVRLGVDYLEHKDELDALAEKVVYTGPIDAYYGYQFGELEYRSVSFETEVLDQPNYQGNAVVNYTEYEVPYTSISSLAHRIRQSYPENILQHGRKVMSLTIR